MFSEGIEKGNVPEINQIYYEYILLINSCHWSGDVHFFAKRSAVSFRGFF